MRWELGPENQSAAKHLSGDAEDGSGIGVNYTDEYLLAFKVKLDDGRRVSCSRRGLELTLKVGDARGKALLRRLEHGPDKQHLLQAGLEEAAAQAGFRFRVENGILVLEAAD